MADFTHIRVLTDYRDISPPRHIIFYQSRLSAGPIFPPRFCWGAATISRARQLCPRLPRAGREARLSSAADTPRLLPCAETDVNWWLGASSSRYWRFFSPRLRGKPITWRAASIVRIARFALLPWWWVCCYWCIVRAMVDSFSREWRPFLLLHKVIAIAQRELYFSRARHDAADSFSWRPRHYYCRRQRWLSRPASAPLSVAVTTFYGI